MINDYFDWYWHWKEIKIQSFRKQSSKKGHSISGFQKFLCVLTGMKKLFFLYFKFFGSGHFLVIFSDVMDQKNGRSKKSYLSKKSVFSCLSTSSRNFWTLLMLWLNFHAWLLNLWIFISRWRNIFSKKFLAQIIVYG